MTVHELFPGNDSKEKNQQILESFELLSDIIKICLNEGCLESLVVMVASPELEDGLICYSTNLESAISMVSDLGAISSNVLEKVLGGLEDAKNSGTVH